MTESRKKSKIVFFKSSDYNLDIEERKVLYKDYKIVLCEKCNEKVNNYKWHCKKCYKNETTEEEKYRMLYGRCKSCKKVMKINQWCKSCNIKRFQKDFINWTSKNNYIDLLIQDNQISSCCNNILEWIPYSKFTDIKFIAEGGFSKVYSATWLNGRIEKWNQVSNNWKRSGSFKVALKILNNQNKGFLNELKFLEKFHNYHNKYIIECYGITQEPNTLNYALVLKLKDCSLRNYLDNYYNTLTLKDKLEIIERICLGLNCIHSYNMIHGDLHSRNILHSFKKKSDIVISDFGFCRPVNKMIEEKKVYGIIPYIAPEVLRGKKYTQASDIYSLGIIINEIIFGNQPFNSLPYDERLAIEICKGLRPNIRDKTPKPLAELIRKCWDENLDKRPKTDEICYMLWDFKYKKNEKNKESPYNYRNHMEQYEKYKETTYDLVNELNESTILVFPPDLLGLREKSKSIYVNSIRSGLDILDECSDCVINPNLLLSSPYGAYNKPFIYR